MNWERAKGNWKQLTTTFNVVSPSDTLTIAAELENEGSVAGTLIKSGAGTLALTAANIYTGGTQINGGTLALV